MATLNCLGSSDPMGRVQALSVFLNDHGYRLTKKEQQVIAKLIAAALAEYRQDLKKQK